VAPPLLSLLMLSRLCVAPLLAFSVVAKLQADDADAARERRTRAHTTFLAADLLEGRAAGARGHALAMAYVCAQFERLGLEPAGEGGYLQPIALRESKLDRDAGKLVIRRAGSETPLANVNETIVRPAAGASTSEVTAPAVFVGFGISAPELGYDDFAQAVDVRGKIAVILAGSPTRLPATARAHYSRQKNAELAARGAVGVISLETPAEERRTPWAVAVNRGRFPTMRLVNADGSLHEAFPELRASASVSRAAAGKFFTGTSKTIEAVFAAAERGGAQALDLRCDVTLAGRAEVGDARSANVLAWLPGTDPALAGEPLVITAHLDHQGIGPAVNGDTIYNGALDNALGTAVMLAIAEELATGPRPARPVLFASLTGEEKGLLGATHLSRHPPARVRRYAANLNIDMPVILAPVRDLTALGAEHSSLGGKFTAAAARQGFTTSPDPQPDEVFFVRSDQYPFVRAGVPALALKSGLNAPPGGPDLKAIEEDFRKNRYHRPGDDLSQPIHWPSVAAFTRVAADLARSIADDATPPKWNPGDFFGTRFGAGADRAAGKPPP
jgi:Zn-dependent M28 family amino/carboxypeptidase